MALEEIFVNGATGFMNRLVSVAAKKIGKAGAVDRDLQKLKDTLEMIAAVTSDAEKKQVKYEVVQIWLRRLQDVAYDVDDLLDEMSYEAIGQSQENEKAEKVTVLPKIKFASEIAKRIKIINQELDEIAKHNVMFHLEHSIEDDQNLDPLDRRAHSFIGDSKIVGREQDKSRIVEMLLITNPSSSSSNNFSPEEKISVISIVGMRGLGKTTLAQLVYKDHSIERSFEPRVWVCISEDFDIFLILRNILESITQKKCDDFSNVDVLVKKVQEEISGKKYLLVLDDLWNENAEDWEKLKGYLSGGAQGSKILVTTRKVDVASIVKGTIIKNTPYNLTTLSNQDCWLIIKNTAFFPGGPDKTPTMTNIGEEISRQCGGLPLAANFLGNLMRLKRKESDWLAIRDDDVFNTPENPNKIILLKLSYDNLSSQLKKCFSYCSLFPKGRYIYTERLIRLWMAEGFLHPCTGSNQNSPEDIGNNYFLRLLSCSFFQVVEKDDLGDITRFKMHDLVHDLALSVVGSHEVTILNANEMENDVSRIRRLLLITEIFPTVLDDAKNLRTVFFQNQGFFYPSSLSNKRLRVILRLMTDKRETNIISSDLKFKHMRYLDLSYSDLKDVHAESIHQLYNLQTLDLFGSENVQKILTQIGCLINLRHLDLSYSDAGVLHDSVTRLTNLQTLSIRGCKDISVLPTNIVSLQILSSLDISCTRIAELPDSISLIHSLKRLELSGCEELKSLPRNLGALTQLRSLNLAGTGMTELPESWTSNLFKLEIVNLGTECEYPKDISNWVELRKLTYGGKTDGVRMPRGIEKLTRLEVLNPYLVSKEEEISTGSSSNDSTTSSIHQLADLNSLWELFIINLQNVRGVKLDAESAKLKDKQNIRFLHLQWKSNEEVEEEELAAFDEEEEEEEEDLGSAAAASMVLGGLQPHPNLEILCIKGFPCLKPPKWIGSYSCLPCLVNLTFENCKSCTNLVGLGQLPCLEVLEIKGMNSLKSLGKEFYYQPQEEEEEEEEDSKGSSKATTLFPSLKNFRIEYMRNLEEWCPIDNSYPCLEELHILCCDNLISIPDLRLWSSSLRHLEISWCNMLKESIPYGLKKESLTFLKRLYFEDHNNLMK